MVDLLALVVLVAIFFGIGLASALNGVIILFISIVIGWSVVLLLGPLALGLYFKINNLPPPKQPKKPKKPANPTGGAILVFLFLFTYLLTALILWVVLEYSTLELPKAPSWVAFLLPTIPFLIIYIVRGIKNRAGE